MPKLTRRLPKYGIHRATNRAVVYLDGRAVYLGPYGSPESRAKYKAALADWLSGKAESGMRTQEPHPGPTLAKGDLTITQLALRYRDHCKAYYGASRETHNLGLAIRPVRMMFGRWKAVDFGPLQLRETRERMVQSGLARKTINDRVNRIRRMFKWAVGQDLIPPSVLDRLRAVESLRPGRGGRERDKVQPVSWGDVEKTLPHLNELAKAMVLFGWYTGARPGELVKLTTGMIDQGGLVWVARLHEHKNSWRGQTREILIGPRAQEVLQSWLMPSKPDEPVFSPRRADSKQKKRKGRRLPGATYSRCGFAQAVRRACERAGVPVWSPNQLRHAAATRLREEHGIEAAQVALGHAKPDTTLIYAAAAKARAVEIIRSAG